METLIGLCKNGILKVFTPRVVPIRSLQKRKSVRYMLGVPPYKGKSLEKKLEEANYQDPKIYYKVDIGFPQTIQNRTEGLQQRIAHSKKLKGNLELEKKARENKLLVCLDDVSREWSKENAPEHIKSAAEYYGVFQDLFGDAFFYPQVGLHVAFKFEQSFVPVYRGNLIKPNQNTTIQSEMAAHNVLHNVYLKQAAISDWINLFRCGLRHSTLLKPAHSLCPKTADTWCKYQQAIQKKEAYDHNEHFQLAPVVMEQGFDRMRIRKAQKAVEEIEKKCRQKREAAK
ncbi:39S ribosomal protein L38, mitochondrial [Homalodisca vitripennis]|nr:39S ribosomal protein L38, mitochondrial [Homalodisca vitripennis]